MAPAVLFLVSSSNVSATCRTSSCMPKLRVDLSKVRMAPKYLAVAAQQYEVISNVKAWTIPFPRSRTFPFATLDENRSFAKFGSCKTSPWKQSGMQSVCGNQGETSPCLWFILVLPIRGVVLLLHATRHDRTARRRSGHQEQLCSAH